MPRLKTVFVAACLALSVSSLGVLDARQAVATDPVSRVPNSVLVPFEKKP